MNNPLLTKVHFEKPTFRISYQSNLFLIGSCFSDNIGKQLQNHKFNLLLNPYGVLYNPLSIENALKRSMLSNRVAEDDLLFHDNLWHSFDLHGSFSNMNKNKLLDTANTSIAKAHSFLKTAEFLFVTFGTAWIYRYRDNGKVVANCHKLPASAFIRERLPVETIVKQWEAVINQLYAFNPTLKIIFTVSPVKHLKDGAHENQLSKATLLLAINELVESNTDRLYYFPSYEIVNDELRDYRFYADDMTHISTSAQKYIYEIFKTTFFNSDTIQQIAEIEKIVKAASHKVMHNNREEIKKFSSSILKKIEKLENTQPFINLHTEKKHFNQLINEQ